MIVVFLVRKWYLFTNNVYCKVLINNIFQLIVRAMVYILTFYWSIQILSKKAEIICEIGIK